jgi:hypothetical protein
MKSVRLRRRHALLFALAAAAALYASLGVTTAAAARHDARFDSSACQFSSVDTLSAFSSVARGDDAREPAMNDFAAEVPAAAKGKGKGGKPFKATVPVYFHVVTDGVTGAVTDAAISEQMTVMNFDFSGFEGGYNTGFKFELAGVDRSDNADWFNAGPGSPAERAMKKALHRGGGNALNWYSTTAGAFLGWAYFPDVLKKGNAYLDGIVVDWESMVHTSTRYAGRYDLGKTGVHEAGHWVNLHHVFNGGCNNWGDYVADTPPQLIATSGCPEGQDSCREPGLDSIHNYMDYSYDACYNQFTAGQAARMQDAWLYWRAP